MTILMDKFFVRIGFELPELERISIRGYLYFGMIFLLGVIFSFLIMTIFS